jgi:phosphoadenosine phosphosulfate reductase
MQSIYTSELAAMNREVEGYTAEGIIAYAHEHWGEQLGATTAFGYGGVYLMYLFTRLGIAPEIYFVDTGMHFPETYRFAEEIRAHFGLPIHTIRADEAIRDYVHDTLGPHPWLTNANLCCHFLKVAPLLQMLPQKDAWVSSLRRDESPSRATLEVFGLDSRGTLKVNPLAHYTGEEIWEEIRAHGIPYHPLHDKGYTSIGCRPCTVPVRKGEHERSGRWKGSGKLECGLHL